MANTSGSLLTAEGPPEKLVPDPKTLETENRALADDLGFSKLIPKPGRDGVCHPWVAGRGGGAS